MVTPGSMRSAFVKSDNMGSAPARIMGLRLAMADKSVYAPAPA
jgi:hypothetical protein